MGLDTSHDCWHGAYSAFSRWRNKLAEVAGYELYMHGPYETARINWGRITDDNIQGKWNETPKDPLIVLIAHSDCDGTIYPKQAVPLANRLEELLPLLKDDGGGHIGPYKKRTQLFIDGLRLAASKSEAIDFH